MNAPASITITPVRVADLLAEGERMPVYVNNSLPIDLVDRGRVVLLVAGHFSSCALTTHLQELSCRSRSLDGMARRLSTRYSQVEARTTAS